MAKVVFRFFEVIVKEDDVGTFIKKMDDLLKKFAGSAYHFRYYIEEPPNTSQQDVKENRLRGPHLNEGLQLSRPERDPRAYRK